MRIAVLVAAALLGGCDSADRAITRAFAPDGVCLPVNEEKRPEGLEPGDPLLHMYRERELDRCIVRWSYRLASIEGRLQDLADAVLANCQDDLERYSSDYLSWQFDTKLPDQTWNYLKLKATPSSEKFRDYARNRALAQIARGRRYKCDAG